MQKDKAEKFYLTKRKLQMRKTAKITDYFPGNRDCMRKKQSPPQKDGGDFEKEKYKKDFLLLPEWHRAHLYCEIAIVYQEFPSGRISREGSRGSSRKTVRIYLLIWSRMPCLLMFLGSHRSWLTQIR